MTNVLKISKKLNGIRLPEVLFGGASGHEIMRRTLSITHKFASGGPSSGGDGGWSQTGEHEWEVTAYEPFPSDIDQRLDPANGGDPNPGDNMQAFDEAVQAVRNILQEKGDNSCAKFFGRVGEDALNKIVAMVSESNFVPLSDSVTGIKMVVDPVAGADFNMPSNGYTTIGPTAVFINSRGPFVDGRAKRIGHQYSATLKSRALQILHEIGHLVVTGVTRGEVKIEVGGEMRTYKVSNLTFLLAPDGPGSEYGLSVANTDKVEKACGEQINALDRKKS